MTRRALCVFLIGLLIAPIQARAELRQVREVHYQMGTFLEITIWHADPEQAREILRRSVQEVHRLERILSHYDPESDLSRFNDHAGHGRTNINPELYKFLSMTIDFSRKTSGYFDATVGPLADLWKESAKKSKVPDHRSLAAVLKLVGFGKLLLYGDGEAELLQSGMKVDPGGMGKGYAVDRACELLKKAGVKAALVNFGGSSMYALGRPPGVDSWRIGVKGTDGTLVGILHLKDKALSTSRSYGRFWEIGGKKYGHLLNPRSGMPMSEARSATVVAPTATAAEALTKPLIITGDIPKSWNQAFPQTEAVLFDEKGALTYSEGFPATVHWEVIRTP